MQPVRTLPTALADSSFQIFLFLVHRMILKPTHGPRDLVTKVLVVSGTDTKTRKFASCRRDGRP